MWALTDYCREEFEKFRIFLHQKSAETQQFSCEMCMAGVGFVNRIFSVVKMFQPMPVNRLTDGEICSRFTIFLCSFYRFTSSV